MSGRQPQAEGRKEKILVEPYRVANLCQKNKKLSIALGGTFLKINSKPKARRYLKNFKYFCAFFIFLWEKCKNQEQLQFFWLIEIQLDLEKFI